jgi:sugar O-acyltransferase (sialic acid O-acetyltransferase NeuD family)
MKLPILIYGAGGLGRELLSMLKSMTLWEPCGFIDDLVTKGSQVKGIEVLGGIEILPKMPRPVHLVLAIGDPITKQKLYQELSAEKGINYPTLIHPRAILQETDSIRLGSGTIVTAGCVLTNDIKTGDHVLINLNCTIGHDTRIGGFTSLMPGVNLAGNVSVGESVLIGSGANVLNGVTLGSCSTVGAGAVVTKDVPSDVIVVGIPAKTKWRD